MEWDPQFFQGRRKEQVENNNKIAFWAVVGFMVTILVVLILG